jgi:hypothetical protein
MAPDTLSASNRESLRRVTSHLAALCPFQSASHLLLADRRLGNSSFSLNFGGA